MIREEVKELFIPEWRRLLLTIVLSGVIYGLIHCFFAGSKCLPLTTFLLIIGGPEALFENLLDLFLSINTQIVEKILTIIILYFLSCLIIYLYDKRGKK
jgi:hypothetical protein